MTERFLPPEDEPQTRTNTTPPWRLSGTVVTAGEQHVSDKAEERIEFSPREDLVPAQQSREITGFNTGLDTIYML